MFENEIVEKSHLNVIVETIRAVQAKAEKEGVILKFKDICSV